MRRLLAKQYQSIGFQRKYLLFKFEIKILEELKNNVSTEIELIFAWTGTVPNQAKAHMSRGYSVIMLLVRKNHGFTKTMLTVLSIDIALMRSNIIAR